MVPDEPVSPAPAPAAPAPKEALPKLAAVSDEEPAKAQLDVNAFARQFAPDEGDSAHPSRAPSPELPAPSPAVASPY